MQKIRYVWYYFRQHKTRFLLCSISMSVAITSMLVLSYLSKILHQQMHQQMEQMGVNFLYLNLSSIRGLPFDWQKALMECPWILNMSKVQSYQLDIMQETRTVQAVDASYFQMKEIVADEGRLFSPWDQQVALIGSGLKDQWKVNDSLVINHQWYQIVGILPPLGETLLGNEDECIFIPYHQSRNGSLMVQIQCQSKDHLDLCKNFLFIYFEIYFPRNEIQIVSQSQMLDAMNQLLLILKQILLSIAFLSFLVSLIGIMNVMLIGIEQRKTEIGIKKALGATQGEILKQFLLEIIWIAVLGVILGFGMSVLLISLCSFFFHTSFLIEWEFLLQISFVCIGMGLIAGIVPAYLASKKEVVESLRM